MGPSYPNKNTTIAIVREVNLFKFDAFQQGYRVVNVTEKMVKSCGEMASCFSHVGTTDAIFGVSVIFRIGLLSL